MGQQQQNGSSGKSIRTCSRGCWNGCLISRVPLKSGEKRPLRASKWLDSLGESKDTAVRMAVVEGDLAQPAEVMDGTAGAVFQRQHVGSTRLGLSRHAREQSRVIA